MRLTRRAALGSIALLAAGCGAPTSDTPGTTPTPAPDLHVLAEEYVRLTLKLAQHQKTLVETWLGPREWMPGAREPVEAIRQRVVRLEADLRDAGAGASGRGIDQRRGMYLQRQARALHTAAYRLLGEPIGLAREAEMAGIGRLIQPANTVPMTTNLDGGPLPPLPAVRARETLERTLPGKGPLVDRLMRFQGANAIPRARLVATALAAIDACRTGTAAMIPLPNGESIDFDLEEGLGLEGQAVYQGSYRTRVRLEGTGSFDVAHLLWLVAHETYPGHHLQYVLADRDLVRAHDWQERQLHPGFGPHLLHSEGLAENGADLLLEGDAFARMCRDVLVPAAGLSAANVERLVAVRRALTTLGAAIVPIAVAYLDEGLSAEAAAERLAREAVVPDAQGLLMTIEKQRTRVLAYPLGLAETRLRTDRPDRWSDLADEATYLSMPPWKRID